MKMIMSKTKKDLMELNAVLARLSKYGNTKFKYFVLKNLTELKPTIEVLLKLEESIDLAAPTFISKKNELIRELGTVSENSIYIDTSNKDIVRTFNEKLRILQEEYSEECQKMDLVRAEYLAVLSTVFDEPVFLTSLSLDNFPETEITIEMLEVLNKWQLIKE